MSVDQQISGSADIPPRCRAAVLIGRGEIRMEERPVPTPEPDEVLIKVVSVGVCARMCTTTAEGRIGDFVVRPGRWYSGTEVSGHIVAVARPSRTPDSASGWRSSHSGPVASARSVRPGDTNLCPDMRFYATPPIDGAFCDYVTIQSAFAHRIPDSVSYEVAGPAGAALGGVSGPARKAQIVPGSRS